MKILFLDQSSQLGGAELCLTDIAQQFYSTSLVGVFAEGTFSNHLRQHSIPVNVLTDQTLQVQKASGLLAGVKSLRRLIPLIIKVAQLSRDYDLIYANTPKALVVGALASFLSHRPLVYHLHDIISPDHFSRTNRRVAVALANRAALIIANSQASREAFIQAGGHADRVHVVYNGFRPERYLNGTGHRDHLRHELIPRRPDPANPSSPFLVGHFSRLSPWKGQHVLIDALPACPDHVMAVFVGDALFGEQDYVQWLHQRIQSLNLEHRVKFLGFRSDIPQLMTACNLVTHTSTAPEPLGRVIIEAMLCGTPVVAAAAGGAVELIEHGQTGWLSPPGNSQKLADIITTCCHHPEDAMTIAETAKSKAHQRFNVNITNQQITELLNLVVEPV